MTGGETGIASDNERALAAEVGEVVAAMTAGRLQTSGRKMVRSILSWAEHHGAFSIKRQARLLGISQSVLSHWRRDDPVVLPSLQRVLEVGMQNGLPLVSLFRAEGAILGEAPPKFFARRWARESRTFQARQKIVVELERIAARVPPVTLATAGRQLLCCPRALKAIAPALCDRILARSAEWRRRLCDRKERWGRYRIRIAIAELAASGEIATIARIGLRLSKSGLLRKPSLRQYAKSLTAESGTGLVADIGDPA